MTEKTPLAEEFIQEFKDCCEDMDFGEALQATLANYPAARRQHQTPWRIVFSDESVVTAILSNLSNMSSIMLVIEEK